MDLKDIKTLQDIIKEYGIRYSTLQTRLASKNRDLKEGIDYRRLGKGQSIIFTPEGVEKITK